MQKNQTARIGTVPEIRPLVKEPKYLPASGSKVLQSAPRISGTSIRPPGILSMVFLMFMNPVLSAWNSGIYAGGQSPAPGYFGSEDVGGGVLRNDGASMLHDRAGNDVGAARGFRRGKAEAATEEIGG